MKYKEIFTISPQFTKHQFSVYAFARDANTISVPATPATLIAVDRRKPQPPLRPTLSDIGKADYHNLSEVTVSWGRAQGATYYQLYRATDSAIFAQDLESRRLKGNHYAGRTELDIFENNTTWFDAFRQKDAAAVAPALVRTLATMELPQLFGHVKGTPEWNNVTPIWQYWADWYYPSLRVNNTLDEIQALADLDGNQAAFTLLNSEPISELTYTDKVNGAVNNRYYYRLRSQGLNLSQSLWGLTSLGKAAAVPSVPPRTPVFTKVEAGDRQITLEWALNREPDLKGYVLYRSQNKDLLEDLRWFDVEFPQGSAAVQRIEIDDPRIVVRNGAIEISDALPIQSIVGVYRANEFDFKRPLSMAQVQAVNFRESERSFQHDSVAHTYRISLNRVADGVNMVVVVRSSLGFYTLLKYKHANYPYLDNSVQGLTTYFYKLLAKNSSNISSSNGEIQSAKAFEIEPPIVPEFTIIRATLGGVDEIVLRTIHLENLEVAIQKRQVGDNSWRRWIEWNTRSVFTDSNINRGHSIEYRILVRTLNKLVCTQPFQIESYPI